MEISNRFTSTDYLDDASDLYFDNETIRANYGDVAAELADRHFNLDGTTADQKYYHGKTMRGNPQFNDAYIFTVVTLHYKLNRTPGGLPKF